MPTVVDPELKDQTNNPETPTYKEPELFAAEIEMEKKSSNFGPLVMVLVLVLCRGRNHFLLRQDVPRSLDGAGRHQFDQPDFEVPGRRQDPFQHRNHRLERE